MTTTAIHGNWKRESKSPGFLAYQRECSEMGIEARIEDFEKLPKEIREKFEPKTRNSTIPEK